MRQALFLVTAFGIFAGCIASANADEPDAKPITIPLKDIWLFVQGAREYIDLSHFQEITCDSPSI